MDTGVVTASSSLSALGLSGDMRLSIVKERFGLCTGEEVTVVPGAGCTMCGAAAAVSGTLG